MNTTVEPASLTVAEIVSRVSAVKPISEASFWRLKIELGLSPIGVRQRPARYPGDVVQTILKHFGVSNGVNITASAPLDTAAGRLASMSKLRAAKKNGRAKR